MLKHSHRANRSAKSPIPRSATFDPKKAPIPDHATFSPASKKKR